MEYQKNSDRRSHQRYAAHLPLSVSGIDFEVATDTKDISGSGLYCQVDRFIPVMTKLALTLCVPLIVRQKKVAKTLHCTGVVVRVNPEAPQSAVRQYSLGVFFTDISGPDRDVLNRYVEQTFCAGRN